MKTIRVIVSIALLIPVLLSTGCSGLGILGAVAQGLSGLGGGGGIDLSGGGSGGGGLGTGPLEPGSSGLGGSIPQPGSLTSPPQGSNTLTPPNLSGASSQQIASELRQRGISVSGNPDEAALRNCLIAAKQVRPQNTQNLRIYFRGGGGSSGILGMWSSSGNITMYTNNAPTATLHEMVHHATLYQASTQGAQVGQRVLQWIRQRCGGSERSWPAQVTPGSYARTNEDEFQAEFFSVMRVMDLNLPWNRLAENGESGAFNPPQELRQIANEFYDPSGATGGATTGTGTATGTATAGQGLLGGA